MAAAALSIQTPPMERPESGKYTHQAVNYEHPSKHEYQFCAGCVHYIHAQPPRCEGVKEPIRPEDWCKRFKAKK